MQIQIIKKMCQIMLAIETRIQQDAAAYLPKQRSRFIDLTTLGVSELEDSFFTYDQIKNLVFAMVQRHETGGQKWHIDVDHCTADQVAVIAEPGNRLISIPVALFMATNISQNRMH